MLTQLQQDTKGNIMDIFLLIVGLIGFLTSGFYQDDHGLVSFISAFYYYYFVTQELQCSFCWDWLVF